MKEDQQDVKEFEVEPKAIEQKPSAVEEKVPTPAKEKEVKESKEVRSRLKKDTKESQGSSLADEERRVTRSGKTVEQPKKIRFCGIKRDKASPKPKEEKKLPAKETKKRDIKSKEKSPDKEAPAAKSVTPPPVPVQPEASNVL